MKHFDNLTTLKNTSHHHSNHQPDYNSKYFKKELLPIILLITVGTIGTLYSLSRGTGNNLSRTTSKITSNKMIHDAEFSTQPEKALLGSTSFSEPLKNQLLIKGEKEVKQPLSFSIENFNKKAKYDLHLGDGKVLHPTVKTIHYAYQNPGNFEVKLIINYNGESARLFKENIQIATAIEVAPGAHMEQ